MEKLSITKNDLSKAFEIWFNNYKTDGTKFYDVSICDSVDEYRKDCADYMFDRLCEIQGYTTK